MFLMEEFFLSIHLFLIDVPASRVYFFNARARLSKATS